mmetsp:Transcript_1542/g.1937  ORF Transcript_1542/g.1937 Transcript_1542/m.1937 type:complete len:146 (+) Transcript_1542:370-807(+)
MQSGKRFGWAYSDKEKKKKKNRKKFHEGTKQSRRQERERRRNTSPCEAEEENVSSDWNPEEWEKQIQKALKKSDFNKMRSLFLSDLFKTAKQSGSHTASRDVKKRYRVLSTRFHPDKHAAKESSENYKIAFQALNDAHEEMSFII